MTRAAAVFTRGELGLSRSDRPRGVLLAVGPTGTGKTELVLLVARDLFGEDRVRRFDLSEYQRADAVERLLGADALDSGAFGRAASGASPRVWLFDELEKAHPKVWDLFIQMLEPGRITMANGEVVSLRGDYVAFTSNLGATEAMRMARSSFASIEQAVLRRVAESLQTTRGSPRLSLSFATSTVLVSIFANRSSHALRMACLHSSTGRPKPVSAPFYCPIRSPTDGAHLSRIRFRTSLSSVILSLCLKAIGAHAKPTRLDSASWQRVCPLRGGC